MKVAIIGSRGLLTVDIEKHIPSGASEIVSGGAKGIDTLARDYAYKHNLPLKEFLPNYTLFGRGAPIKRNDEIIAYSDMVLAFWDGKSRGTQYVITKCEKTGTPITVITI